MGDSENLPLFAYGEQRRTPGRRFRGGKPTATSALRVEDFEEFDQAHPDIWERFCDIALDLIRKGKSRYSADAILHVIRFEYDTSTNGEAPKINNNLTPAYARKFQQRYPQHSDFFATRRSRADHLSISSG